jgi:predicted Rossmann-fold nucleotide-binding protein
VRLSDAYVVVPGGIGTTLELVMIWQLLQVGHLQSVPLVLVGTMWEELIFWARRHMTAADPALADAEDTAIPYCVEDVDAAAAVIRADLLNRKDPSS